MKKMIVTMMVMVGIIAATGTASAAVDGITKDNYSDYVKPYTDEYGYNTGECEREYLEGEEYFYNEYYDHWNVDRIYDEALIPPDWNKATEATATAVEATAPVTEVKATVPTKKAKAKKAKKAKKKSKKSKKKSKKSKKSN